MTAVVPGDFSNSIQNHFLFFIELLPFLFWPFLLFYFCVNCFLFVSPSTCTDEEWNEPSASPFSFLHSLSFTVPFPILRFAHLQPPVTMSKVFSPFPETSEEWTEVEILSLSQTHTTQSLKERTNFLYHRGDNWHFWEKQQVFSYSLTAWRKLCRNIRSLTSVYFICTRTLTFHSTLSQCLFFKFANIIGALYKPKIKPQMGITSMLLSPSIITLTG